MSFWTPEREAQAIKLWTEGRSATEIAWAMGARSRNVIIGKLARMGYRRKAQGDPRLLAEERKARNRERQRLHYFKYREPKPRGTVSWDDKLFEPWAERKARLAQERAL